METSTLHNGSVAAARHRSGFRPAIERLLQRCGLKVLRYNRYVTAYDHRLLTHITDGVKTVFDVGANEGQTISEIRAEFPEAHIYSFEPGAEALTALKRTWGADSAVTIVEAAVSSKSGTAEFIDDPKGTVYSRIAKDHDEGRRSVPCVKLDEWCPANGLERIDLLKIDTEGHDLEVIEGASELLGRGAVASIVMEFGGIHELLPLHDLVQAMTTRKYILVFTFAHRMMGPILQHGNAFFVHESLAPRLRLDHEL